MPSDLLVREFSTQFIHREIERIFLALYGLHGVALRFDSFMRGSMLGGRSTASKLQPLLGKHQ